MTIHGEWFLMIKLDCVGHIEVQMTIAIVIGECCAHTPARIANFGLLGRIRKCAIAIVAIKCVGSVVANVEVRPAIIIVISYRDTHSPMGIPHSSLPRDIDKRAVMIISVKSIRHTSFPLEQFLPAAAIYEIEIGP